MQREAAQDEPSALQTVPPYAREILAAPPADRNSGKVSAPPELRIGRCLYARPRPNAAASYSQSSIGQVTIIPRLISAPGMTACCPAS